MFNEFINLKSGAPLGNSEIFHLSADGCSCSVGYLTTTDSTDCQMITWLMNDVSERSWFIAGAILAFDESSEKTHQKQLLSPCIRIILRACLAALLLTVANQSCCS